jgi:FkbM family methyltransferase
MTPAQFTRRVAERLHHVRRLSAVLPPTRLWRAHSLVIMSAFVLLPLGFRRRLAWVVVSLPNDSRMRFHFTDFSQLQALEEVLIDRQYELSLTGVRSIVDLGANAGQGCCFLHASHPQPAILAVEPDPSTFVTLHQNVQAIEAIRIDGVAITDRDEPLLLERSRGRSWSSTVLTDQRWSESTVEVAGLPVDSLLARYDIEMVDLLKVDIEGMEVRALTTGSGLMRVGTVMGEFHPNMLGQRPEDSLAQLKEYGRFERGWLHRGNQFVLTRSDGVHGPLGRP